jgi:radical SAM protein with 4Fe4S-binding SPASM domain
MTTLPYLMLDPNRCRLVRGAVGAAIYDLQGGAVIPVPPSFAAYLHETADGFQIPAEIPLKMLSFLDSLKIQGIGYQSATLPEPASNPGVEKNEIEPVFAWLELTQSCNLRCIHCYGSCSPDAGAADAKDVLSKNEWMGVIAQLKECGFQRIQFIGGEPLLHPAFLELLFEAGRFSFSFIEVFSNLLCLDETILNALGANQAQLATTVYSVTPEIHDAVTGQNGSHEITVKNIRRAVKWNIPVRVGCIVTNRNEGKIGDMQRFVEENGAFYGGQDQARPSGRGGGATCQSTVPRRMVTPPFTASQPSFRENCSYNPCWKGKIAITEDGSVMPCVFARESIAGNIRWEKLAQIIQGNGLSRYWRLTKDQIEICKVCEFRYACPDCRPLAQGWNGDLFAKTYGCSYDPYTGQWK